MQMRYEYETKPIELFNPKNIGLDTKIITIAQLVVEIWAILCYGSHLGRHLEFFEKTSVEDFDFHFFVFPNGPESQKTWSHILHFFLTLSSIHLCDVLCTE